VASVSPAVVKTQQKITKKTKIDLDQLTESFVPLVAFCSICDLQPARLPLQVPCGVEWQACRLR
jgi:hypothetical protein